MFLYQTYFIKKFQNINPLLSFWMMQLRNVSTYLKVRFYLQEVFQIQPRIAYQQILK